MATGVHFPESNLALRAPTPEDAAAGTVYTLHVRLYQDLDGAPNVLSCWELTDDEVELIVKTRRIWHNAWGHTVTPMFLTAHDPFGAAGWLRQR